mgnify:CR=1 FL=1
MNIDTTLLDKLIIGRVDPHIYAFTTETVPNYLKVGDTYRAVSTRLDEWKKYYPNLKQVYQHSAKLEDGMIFRDFAVHNFLINVKHRERLHPDLLKGIYYSREFFKNATTDDLQEAILDIYKSYSDGDGRYTFYTPEYSPTEFIFERDKTPLKPRPNQKDTIDRFATAIKDGRTNLLMYAVMRFGKSFTAMSCALKMKAKLVVIVSAKADVMIEWKKTVEKTKQFEEYIFIDKESLQRNHDVFDEALQRGKKVVVFLTLQDLQGDEIKERHKKLLSQSIDLLIVDETHFGARAEQYGKILRNVGLSTAQIRHEISEYDEDDFQSDVKKYTKIIKKYIGNKNTAFWGASIFLEYLLSYKNDFKNVVGIIDKSPEQQGKNISGYMIFSPEDLKDIKVDNIIMTIQNNNRIIYPKIKEYIEKNHLSIKLMPNIFE